MKVIHTPSITLRAGAIDTIKVRADGNRYYLLALLGNGHDLYIAEYMSLDAAEAERKNISIFLADGIGRYQTHSDPHWKTRLESEK